MHNSSEIHSPHNTSTSIQSTVFFSLGMVFVGAVSSLVGIGIAWLRKKLNIQQANQQQLSSRLDAIDGKGAQTPTIETTAIEYPIELIYHPEAAILPSQKDSKGLSSGTQPHSPTIDHFLETSHKVKKNHINPCFSVSTISLPSQEDPKDLSPASSQSSLPLVPELPASQFMPHIDDIESDVHNINKGIEKLESSLKEVRSALDTVRSECNFLSEDKDTSLDTVL